MEDSAFFRRRKKRTEVRNKITISDSNWKKQANYLREKKIIVEKISNNICNRIDLKVLDQKQKQHILFLINTFSRIFFKRSYIKSDDKKLDLYEKRVIQSVAPTATKYGITITGYIPKPRITRKVTTTEQKPKEKPEDNSKENPQKKAGEN